MKTLRTTTAVRAARVPLSFLATCCTASLISLPTKPCCAPPCELADEFEEEEDDGGAAAAATAAAAQQQARAQAAAAAQQQAQATEARRAALAKQEQQALRDRAPPNINRGPLAPAGAAERQQQQSARSPMQTEKVVPSPTTRRFIAPPSNEVRQIKEQRAARLKALRSVLQLRAVDVTLYDAAPLTPYELHTRHQSGKLRVKMCQTGDDDVSIGIQTEEIETDVQACQWPEDGTAPGTSAASSGLEASDSAKTASNLTANIGRLGRFLSSAGLVVETLCTENLLAASGAADAVQLKNQLPFSSRHTRLNLPAALGERTPHHLTFDDSGGALLVAYGKPHAMPTLDASVRKRDAAALRRLATGGMLAHWRLYAPERPWAVLRCTGLPSCCMLPAAKPHLAFAGTEEGTVQLWNLREAGSSHPSVELGGGDRTPLRSPTYASDCLASGAHTAPITALVPLQTSGESDDLSIASLDRDGTLMIWLVLESVELDALDLGQAVGGKERLLRSGSVSLASGGAPAGRTAGGAGGLNSVLPTVCVSMAFLPSDPSRLLVATDQPEVLHRSRYSSTLQPSPEAFNFAGGSSCGATSIAFHPTSPCHFLVGRTDGTVTLYHIDDPQALVTWEAVARGGVVQLLWSPSRPAIFWVLDATDTMHIFDVRDVEPKATVSSSVDTHYDAQYGGGDQPPSTAGDASTVELARPMRFALDGSTTAASVRDKASPQRGTAQRLAAITSRSGGRLSGVEVHVLEEAYGSAQQDEAVQLAHVLGKL